MARGKMKTAGH